jgi:hypothetical protein
VGDPGTRGKREAKEGKEREVKSVARYSMEFFAAGKYFERYVISKAIPV